MCRAATETNPPARLRRSASHGPGAPFRSGRFHVDGGCLRRRVGASDALVESPDEGRCSRTMCGMRAASPVWSNRARPSRCPAGVVVGRTWLFGVRGPAGPGRGDAGVADGRSVFPACRRLWRRWPALSTDGRCSRWFRGVVDGWSAFLVDGWRRGGGRPGPVRPGVGVSVVASVSAKSARHRRQTVDLGGGAAPMSTAGRPPGGCLPLSGAATGHDEGGGAPERSGAPPPSRWPTRVTRPRGRRIGG